MIVNRAQTRFLLEIVVGAASLCLLPTDSLACPVCNTETGVAVRAGIFNEQFWIRTLSTLAPFPILLSFTAAIYFGGGRTADDLHGERHE